MPIVSSRLLRVALAAFALIGSGAAAGAEPRDTITLGMTIEPAGLDPTIAAPVAIGQVVWQNLFEGLTRIDAEGKVLPQLAKDWTVSEDGRTITFRLQDNVTFHNGVAFDSATARFTLDRARGETSTNPQKQFYQVIDRIETPDPETLVLHLKDRPATSSIGWPGRPPSWSSRVRPAPTDRSPWAPALPLRRMAARRSRPAGARRPLLGRGGQAGARRRHVPVHLRSAGSGFGLRSGDVDAFRASPRRNSTRASRAMRALRASSATPNSRSWPA